MTYTAGIAGMDIPGALSISGPATRIQSERLEEEIPSLLKQATNVIELNINYS